MKATSVRNALRRRVKRMYDYFNEGRWENCFALVDPKLTETSKVVFPVYSQQLRDFKSAYGCIRVWDFKISLHLDGSSNKHDPRPFAFVYVVWQDDTHGFHMFRERWVKEGDKWFTRVAGLVPNKSENSQ